MDNRFVVKTTLSREDTAALACQQLRGNKLFMWVCTLLMIACAAVLWVKNNEYKILFTVLVAILLAISLVMEKLIAWAMFRNANKVVGETTYTFTDKNADVFYQLRGGQIPYESFAELVETDARYFLYVQKRAAFVLPKAHFVEGDPARFGEFMTAKLLKPVKRVKG